MERFYNVRIPYIVVVSIKVHADRQIISLSH